MVIEADIEFSTSGMYSINIVSKGRSKMSLDTKFTYLKMLGNPHVTYIMGSENAYTLSEMYDYLKYKMCEEDDG